MTLAHQRTPVTVFHWPRPGCRIQRNLHARSATQHEDQGWISKTATHHRTMPPLPAIRSHENILHPSSYMCQMWGRTYLRQMRKKPRHETQMWAVRRWSHSKLQGLSHLQKTANCQVSSSMCETSEPRQTLSHWPHANAGPHIISSTTHHPALSKSLSYVQATARKPDSASLSYYSASNVRRRFSPKCYNKMEWYSNCCYVINQNNGCPCNPVHQ